MRGHESAQAIPKGSKRYDLEGVLKSPLTCEKFDFTKDRIEPPRVTSTFNFYPKQEDSFMLLRKSQDQLSLMKDIKQKQKQSLIEKHERASLNKMNRIINTFHKSGITGIDDPLNTRTKYF